MGSLLLTLSQAGYSSTDKHKMADTKQKTVEEVPAAQAEEVSEEPKVTEDAETSEEAAAAPKESAEGPTEAAEESEAATEEEATEAPAEAEHQNKIHHPCIYLLQN